MSDQPDPVEGALRSDQEPPRMPLPEAAQRALAEAAARRAAVDDAAARLQAQQEINGREGPEPVRYGDWENKGIASDF